MKKFLLLTVATLLFSIRSFALPFNGELGKAGAQNLPGYTNPAIISNSTSFFTPLSIDNEVDAADDPNYISYVRTDPATITTANDFNYSSGQFTISATTGATGTTANWILEVQIQPYDSGDQPVYNFGAAHAEWTLHTEEIAVDVTGLPVNTTYYSTPYTVPTIANGGSGDTAYIKYRMVQVTYGGVYHQIEYKVTL